MRSVFAHTHCNKRGQTSSPVVGAEIQTGCNSEASLLDDSVLPFALCPLSLQHLGSFLTPLFS